MWFHKIWYHKQYYLTSADTKPCYPGFVCGNIHVGAFLPHIVLFQLTGQWKGASAGGCANYKDTHKNNPIYQVKVDNSSATNQLLLELRGPKLVTDVFTAVVLLSFTHYKKIIITN